MAFRVIRKELHPDSCQKYKNHYNGVYVNFIQSKNILMALDLATPVEILQTLGNRLRRQRLAQDLSQRELAQMAGLSLGAVRKLEGDGRCSLETLVRALQALGLAGELEDLFALRRQSIVQMELAEQARQRQRAPRRRRS
ncbi:MAG: helix-turn-helix domain-containing protein [Candidatus Accumulibacter sp.]|nr:helix-turn-helix domain-containing protein [Accumulibacter sp.]